MRKYWKKNGLTYFSFFAIAAILPILMFGVLNPDSLKTFIRADQPSDLRIWFEPAEIVTHPGIKFKVKIMASYEDKYNLVPKVEASIRPNKDLNIVPDKIAYEKPFSGTVELGNYDVSANTYGTFNLEVSGPSIFTQTTNLNINTAKAVIYSKP